MLASPFLGNFFADKEMLDKVQELLEKLEPGEPRRLAESLRQQLKARLDLLEESRKLTSQLSDMGSQIATSRLAKEKISRSFGNLSALDEKNSFSRRPSIFHKELGVRQQYSLFGKQKSLVQGEAPDSEAQAQDE